MDRRDVAVYSESLRNPLYHNRRIGTYDIPGKFYIFPIAHVYRDAVLLYLLPHTRRECTISIESSSKLTCIFGSCQPLTTSEEIAFVLSNLIASGELTPSSCDDQMSIY